MMAVTSTADATQAEVRFLHERIAIRELEAKSSLAQKDARLQALKLSLADAWRSRPQEASKPKQDSPAIKALNQHLGNQIRERDEARNRAKALRHILELSEKVYEQEHKNAKAQMLVHEAKQTMHKHVAEPRQCLAEERAAEDARRRVLEDLDYRIDHSSTELEELRAALDRAMLLSTPEGVLREAQVAVEQAESLLQEQVHSGKWLAETLEESANKTQEDDDADKQLHQLETFVGKGSLAAELRALRLHAFSVGVNVAGDGHQEALSSFIETSQELSPGERTDVIAVGPSGGDEVRDSQDSLRDSQDSVVTLDSEAVGADRLANG